ncbi:hypothetical protein Syun_023364 [Stephania yunnanensis]|uniref:Uncharacterized protein n=1 Tax=Stephania yunnanensis TaxID=152371 RepID=A0AAP0HZI9_9MAGN
MPCNAQSRATPCLSCKARSPAYSRLRSASNSRFDPNWGAMNDHCSPAAASSLYSPPRDCA